MRALARFLSFLVAITASAGGYPATASINDVTDLWFDPDESGWGVNLIQQGNIAFATFFVYDLSGKAHWFVASNLTAAPATGKAPVVFAGPLFETTGPVFSAPVFNPANVNVREVGRATFEFTPPNAGRLTYSVDGVTVNKQVERQTWASNDLSDAPRAWAPRSSTPSTCRTWAARSR
jgi:hypothetical protein